MPKTRRLLLALPLALLLLTGCETMTPNDFKDRTPKLDLFEYFQGQTHAWGLFEDRFGKVRRQSSGATAPPGSSPSGACPPSSPWPWPPA